MFSCDVRCFFYWGAVLLPPVYFMSSLSVSVLHDYLLYYYFIINLQLRTKSKAACQYFKRVIHLNFNIAPEAE